MQLSDAEAQAASPEADRIAELEAELAEARRQQDAMASVLRVISRSPSDVQQVIEQISETVARLCEADYSAVFRLRDGGYHVGASNRMGSPLIDILIANPIEPGRNTCVGRAALDCRVVHIVDALADDELTTPDNQERQRVSGIRTVLGVPILSAGRSVAVIFLARTVVRPFSDQQISLVQLLGEQALVAIDNARLFDAEQQRTRELQESLDYRTAISDVLTSIGQSARDVKPVLEVIARNSVRLCDALHCLVGRFDGRVIEIAAQHNNSAKALDVVNRLYPMAPDRSQISGRVILSGHVVHVEDVLQDPEYSPDIANAGGWRSILGVPLSSGGQLIGVITVLRAHPGPFSAKQIGLLKTFAEQAVIAINNINLFEAEQERTRELQESLEYQTATSEVLDIIARSRGEPQRVLRAISQAAARLCEADRVSAFRLRHGALHWVDGSYDDPQLIEYFRSHPTPPDRKSIVGRAVADQATVHVLDAQLDENLTHAARNPGRPRTMLGVPLLSDGEVLGALGLSRLTRRSFSAKQIALVEVFADQAVIAIENARLLDELQTRQSELEFRSAELSQSLEYQTAVSGVLNVISRSRADLEPVLQSVVETAVRLCHADHAMIYRLRNGIYRFAAGYGPFNPEYLEIERNEQIPADETTLVGRVALACKAVRIDDAFADPGYAKKEDARVGDVRSMLGVPLLRDGEPIGVIGLVRKRIAPFSDQEAALVATFADQAVIAIENVRLFEAEQARTAELQESLEYQTAISDILRIISSAGTDMRSVFEAIAKSALILCRASWSVVELVRGDHLELEVLHNIGDPSIAKAIRSVFPMPIASETVAARVVRSGDTVHLPSVASSNHPLRQGAATTNYLAGLGVPMLSNGQVIGVIFVARDKVGPFSERQINLLRTFADQAVIAIENARLLDELQRRQKELEARSAELAESLEFQTAISEVLRVISTSGNDFEKVSDVIAARAVELCEATLSSVMLYDGAQIRLSSVRNTISSEGLSTLLSIFPRAPKTGGAVDDAIIKREVTYIPDVEIDSSYLYREGARSVGFRSILAVPMLHDERPIGVITVTGAKPEAFSLQQIELLKTFADQAVIAIQNARLLDELQTRQLDLEARSSELARSADQQRSLVDVGRAVSSSLDMEEVLQTILEHACRMAPASGGALYVYDEAAREFHLQAGYRTNAEQMERARAYPIRAGDPVIGRLHERREAVQFEDLAQLEQPVTPLLDILLRAGVRAILAVPLLHQGKLVGALAIRRRQPGKFAPEAVHLLEAFAAQSAIAINNARLFSENEARRTELAAALEQQTASAEVLEAISRSPDQLLPVLQFIADTSARICATPLVSVFLKEGEHFRLYVTHGLTPAYEKIEKAALISVGRGSLVGRVALTRKTQHVSDMEEDAEYEQKAIARIGGIRTMLGIPLLRSGEAIGVIAMARTEVSPFTERQVELVTTFASQAVIAINNAGLFEQVQLRTRDLEESLAFQTAANELLRIISRSVFDLMPVLQAALNTAVKLCKADMGSIFQREGEIYRWRVGTGLMPEYEELERLSRIKVDRSTLVGRAVLAREAVHVLDAWTDPEYGEKAEARIGNIRTMLGVPLLREGQPIGVFTLARARLESFTNHEIALVTTFADQSVIAIENVRLFNEIREKSHELELASQHKSQFLANMSHELRTPLNAILGYTELMQDGIYGQVPEKAGDVLARVQHNGKHLLGLINQVLDLSKIEAGQFRLNLAEYGLGSIIETVVASTESLATEKKLLLRAEVAPEMPRGHGDEQRIVQVLLNLVGNAIKFTDSGEVRILAGSFAGRFEIAVVDTGAGIPADEIDRIFEEFHQVDSSNTKVKGGTGLGLAIAKRIVEMHGGRIRAESVVGRGSTFKVELPVRVAHDLTEGAEA